MYNNYDACSPHSASTDVNVQRLLRHADTTLNPAATVVKNSATIDGNLLWHTCKDNSVLYYWVDISGKPRHVSEQNSFFRCFNNA